MSDTHRTDKQIAFIKDQIKNDSASLCADHPYYVLDVMAALCRELEAENKELKEQLQDAEELIVTLANCVDGYYIDRGHSSIAEHDAYAAKWQSKGEQ